MAYAAGQSVRQRTPEPASSGREATRPPARPRWMSWVPTAAILWGLAYGALRMWWIVHGAPPFGPRHVDLIVFANWNAVGLWVVAVVIAFVLRVSPWRGWLARAACVVCAMLLAACPLLLLDAVGGLLPGLGIEFYPAAFLSRAACFVEGILLGGSVVAYRRR